MAPADPNTDNTANPATEPTLGDIARTCRNVLRRLGPGGPLALIAATLPAIGAVVLAFAFNIFGPWLKAQGLAGVFLYAGALAILAGLAVLPTHVQAALGGWAFGFALGFPSALAGILGAALIGYVIGLRATGDRAVQLIAEKPKWAAVYHALLGSGFWRTLLIVVLVRGALSPFALMNLVFAATRVNLLAYVLGTVIGIAPRTAAAVFFAVSLQQVTAKAPHERWVWIGSLVLTLIAVVVIGQIANIAVTRVAGNREGAGQK